MCTRCEELNLSWEGLMLGWMPRPCIECFYSGNLSYVLKDKLWLKHFYRETVLCQVCLEKKLGRKLTLEDFDMELPWNHLRFNACGL